MPTSPILTRILYPSNIGDRSMTVPEFYKLGIMERVQTLMNPDVRFFSGDVEISAKAARATLQHGP